MSSNPKGSDKSTTPEDSGSTKGSNADTSKNVDEDPNLIVHVGDTFDLDYDITGKRSEEENKTKNEDVVRYIALFYPMFTYFSKRI